MARAKRTKSSQCKEPRKTLWWIRSDTMRSIDRSIDRTLDARCYWHDAASITMRVECLPPPLFLVFFSRHPTYSCARAVCRSVRPSVRPSVNPSVPQHGAVLCASQPVLCPMLCTWTRVLLLLLLLLLLRLLRRPLVPRSFWPKYVPIRRAHASRAHRCDDLTARRSN